VTGVSTEPSAVSVSGLGKKYRIGAPAGTGRIYERAGRLLRRSREDEDPGSIVWALRNVSFELPAGQVLGVLGRNGSGKSTLMKILARITAPTEGEARLRGRVGALLEVGTGFHPELSGRDNVALSGAILGMSREDVAERFDEIVGFSEIGRFIDTPVKHYSSGMFLRLAFSVSVHLAAEIMLIDEVLAVGDAAFRQKCLERLRSAVASGRTVLFVTHDMAAAEALCDQAIVLEQGEIVFHGDAAQAIRTYTTGILRMPSQVVPGVAQAR
jgi:lipopolysaccharide transport system ATP-binding protein